jgi:hypothetical protein
VISATWRVLLCAIDFDAELLHLLSQAFLAGSHLSRHALKNACELPKHIRTERNLVQALRLEDASLDGLRCRRDPCKLLHIFEVFGHVPHPRTQALAQDVNNALYDFRSTDHQIIERLLIEA